MDLNTAIKRGEEAQSRDPREAPYGYLSVSGFTRMFLWFESIKSLIDYIIECDPIIHDFDPTDAADFLDSARVIVDDMSDLSVENMTKINELVECFSCIEWWGTFHDLAHGESQIALELRSSLRDNDDDQPIKTDEMEDFVKLVQEYVY